MLLSGYSEVFPAPRSFELRRAVRPTACPSLRSGYCMPACPTIKRSKSCNVICLELVPCRQRSCFPLSRSTRSSTRTDTNLDVKVSELGSELLHRLFDLTLFQHSVASLEYHIKWTSTWTHPLTSKLLNISLTRTFTCSRSANLSHI